MIFKNKLWVLGIGNYLMIGAWCLEFYSYGRFFMEFQLLIQGLSVGFLYALAALGFVMIFKSSSVLNFAHGDLLAMGAFIFLIFSLWLNLPIWLAFLLTLVGSFALGFVIERLFLRPLIGEALIQVIMLTVGLAAMFKGLMLFVFGGNLFNYPDFLPKNLSIQWGNINIPPVYIASFLIGIIFLSIFGFFFSIFPRGSICGQLLIISLPPSRWAFM